jgi:oxygen-independent coproporphyrinogen-3 oxidase
MREMTGPRRADSIFFGGGTPSLMPSETVGALIRAVDRLWGLSPDAEITLEANPTSVEAAQFRGYAAAGVNRVSMGIQALNDADLKALGRMHTAAEARAAFDVARAAFDRVSFDLIYARMGQSLADWERELDAALEMSVDHLSLYQLTIEDGTRFGELHEAGKLVVPEDDLAAEMFELTRAMTASAGLPAYEISNHARVGAESRHNLIYWRYGDYAGVGPGAHGRITDPAGVKRATETVRDPAMWMARVQSGGNAIAHAEAVPGADQAIEYLMMAMRLSEGAERSRFAALGGRTLSEAAIETLVGSDHLDLNGDRIAASDRGRLVLNRLIAALLENY